MRKVLNPLGAFALALTDVCRFLPPGLVWPISRMVGTFLYYAKPKRRREIEKAYAHLCGLAGLSDSPRHLAKRYFERQFMLLTGQSLLATASEQRWSRLVRFEGLEQVRESLDRGAGLVLTTFHFGAHLLVLNPLMRLGCTVAPLRPTYMQSIRSPRQRRMNLLNEHVVYVGEASGLASPLRHCVRLLQSNAVLGVAYDGDQGGEPELVPFFGQEYPVRRGAVEMARLGKAPMVLALAGIRNGRYVVRYHPIWYGFCGDDGVLQGEDPLPTTMRHFENMVTEFPECVWWTKPFCQGTGLRKHSKHDEAESADDTD